MPNRSILNMLGLCRRAGKLIYGFDAVKEAVLKSDVNSIFMANNLSAKSKKELLYITKDKRIPLIQTTIEMEEMQTIIGKRTGILAITEQGFSKKIVSMFENEDSNLN